MFPAPGAAVNAARPSPPNPTPQRFPCPLCGTPYDRPSHLAVHLAAPDPDRPGHGMSELDAWTMAAAVAPVEARPPRRRSVA